MPTIVPISELRNYGSILDKVKEGEPVYLTKNGHGLYSIRKIEDEEKYEQTMAALVLLSEIIKGERSGEEDGWLSAEDVFAHFKARGIDLR